MIRSRLATLALVGVLGACTFSSSEASSESGVEGVDMPLPTIGLGSELGRISGGADVREIDTGSVESVVMIGDSITVGAQPFLQEQLQQLGFADVTIVAQELKRVSQNISNNPSGADIASFVAGESSRPGDEQLWIVALGTNDISQYGSVDEIVAEMETVIDAMPDDAPLVWVNTYFADRPEDTAEVNAAIEQVIDSRGNAVVGQWNQIAPSDGVLRGDGVHPNSDGAKVFAALVTTTVADFLQR
ncbi:MAG: GDSL-type esterase/lipase family protein [Ilumatobacter sp.]|uniref:GDSL-type esterase/lipase family protein n=1 Tax=Ilumatobacter sp. TaxID=1967498 RepID=UPI00329A787C